MFLHSHLKVQLPGRSCVAKPGVQDMYTLVTSLSLPLCLRRAGKWKFLDVTAHFHGLCDGQNWHQGWTFSWPWYCKVTLLIIARMQFAGIDFYMTPIIFWYRQIIGHMLAYWNCQLALVNMKYSLLCWQSQTKNYYVYYNEFFHCKWLLNLTLPTGTVAECVKVGYPPHSISLYYLLWDDIS